MNGGGRGTGVGRWEDGWEASEAEVNNEVVPAQRSEARCDLCARDILCGLGQGHGGFPQG